MNVKKWTALCVTILLMLSFVCAIALAGRRENARRLIVFQPGGQRGDFSGTVVLHVFCGFQQFRTPSTSAPVQQPPEQPADPPPEPSSTGPEPTPEPSSSEPVYYEEPAAVSSEASSSRASSSSRRLHPESRFPALSACRRWAQRFIPFPTCSAPA